MGMLLNRQRNRLGVTTTSNLIPDIKNEPKEEVKVEEVHEEEKPQKKFYTRTDIYRMSALELKNLAKSEGLDDTLSGNKLKDVLIKHFGI